MTVLLEVRRILAANPNHDAQTGEFSSDGDSGGSSSHDYQKYASAEEVHEATGQHAAKWFAALSGSEKAAVTNWAGGDSKYEEINSSLRSGAKADSETKGLIRGLDSAISKSSLPNDMVVYRALNAVDPGQVGKTFKPGTVIQDQGFFATSAARSQAKYYVDEFDQSVMMEVRVPKGTQAALIPEKATDEQAGYQAEVLLHRGATFKVIESRLGKPGQPAALHLVLEYTK